MPRKRTEFEKFDATMKTLLKVPHAEIKAKLDAEKAAKKHSTRGRVARRKERS